MDPFQSLLSFVETTRSSLAVKHESRSFHPFLEATVTEGGSMQSAEQERLLSSQFHPLSTSAVQEIGAWRPKGLPAVNAPPADSPIASWLGRTKSRSARPVQVSTGSTKQQAQDAEEGTQENEKLTSTSGRPFEAPVSAGALSGLVQNRCCADWAQIASWRPSGLSLVKAPSCAVPLPAVEIRDQCKRTFSTQCELPADVAEAIASFRPFGLAPIKTKHAEVDSCDSSASSSPQAPHASDRTFGSAFETPAQQAASWRPAGLKPIRLRRGALDESENTPTAPKAATAAARRVFAPSETDSPRAPPRATTTEEGLSPTSVPDVATWRPAGLSPLRIGSQSEDKKTPSPRLRISSQPSPKSGSPRLRPLRLERDLGPLKLLAADPNSSNASSSQSSPNTPRFKSTAQRKGLTLQSRLKLDDLDSNADTENTPPGNVSPSITPGATTPKSAGPSPLAPSNRQRGGQAARLWEKEAKRSEAEPAGKTDIGSIVHLLAALPGLAAVDRPSLQELAASGKVHRCGPNEAAVHQGAPVEHLLVVLRGSLAALPRGATEPLFHLRPGAACPHRLGSASPQGWSASLVAGAEGADCLLVPFHVVRKTVKSVPLRD